jgi:hypothetical protein
MPTPTKTPADADDTDHASKLTVARMLALARIANLLLALRASMNIGEILSAT